MAGGIDVAKFVGLLQSLTNKDKQVREQSQALFQQAKASEADSLFAGFVAVFGSQQVDQPTRKQAAIQLRAMTLPHKGEKDFAWSRVSAPARPQVADQYLKLLEAEPNAELKKQLGNAIVALAECACDPDAPHAWITPGQCGWPALPLTVFRLADATASQNLDTLEVALHVLKELVGAIKKEMLAAQQQLGVVLQAALAHPEIKIKAAGLELVCQMVVVLEKKAWAPLLPTAPVVIQIVQGLAQANQKDLLENSIESFCEVAEIEPNFFKRTLVESMEPAKTMANIVKAKGQIDDGVRGLAMQWLVSYVEARAKWLGKSLPDMPALALESAMHLLLEADDGEQELKEWLTRMDDEEGEEDADEMFHHGEDAIDSICENLPIDKIGKYLFQLIAHFSNQPAWQAQHAAMSAIQRTVEYVEEQSHVNEMVTLLLARLDHPHPRVRYMALYALGQVSNDQAPHFQEEWHKTVVPILLKKMDDESDRVAAMAMSGFVSFGEELDSALMAAYSGQVMEKVVGRLRTTQHRMVQEEAITSIAVIAGVMENDFAQYYSSMMPMLKQFVLHKTGDKEGRLRGKAFECMSLLGLAVGKDTFLPDAKDAIAEMIKTWSQLSPEDTQKEYITEATDRVCKCLKKDFGIFLPHLMPLIYRMVRLDVEDANAAKANDENNRPVQVNMGEGKLVTVRSSKFTEVQQGLQLIETFCESMEGSFSEFVPSTAEAVMPLLIVSDEDSLLAGEARGYALSAWSQLIGSARKGAEALQQPPTLAAELFKSVLEKTLKHMSEEDDAESLGELADALSECLKASPKGIMQAQEVMMLVQHMLKMIDESLARTVKVQSKKKEGAAQTPAELQNEEDDDDGEEDAEESCRRSLEEVLGALMEVSPAEFMPCLTECGNRMTVWLSTAQNRVLALWLACDMLKNLQDKSEAAWPIFMPAIFEALGQGQDEDLRIAACYAINLASGLERFSEAAQQAFTSLAQILNRKMPPKRESKARIAMDNAVAAMMALAKSKPQLCPSSVPAWQLVLAKLPLKEDEEEAKKVHKALVTMLMEENMGLLGQDGSNMGKVLSILAEVYHQEVICDKDTDTLIHKVFTMIPRDKLMQCAGSFTEKQQRKIEKMLATQVTQ